MKVKLVSGSKRARNGDFEKQLEGYPDSDWDLVNVFANPINGILTAVLKPKKTRKTDKKVEQKPEKETLN